MSCWTWGGEEERTHAAIGRVRSVAEAIGGRALLVPRSVRLASRISFSRLACGGAHCLAVTGEGVAFSWGWNAMGQLGDGTTTSRFKPAPIPVLVAHGVRVGAVAAGAAHSAALVDFDGVSAEGGSTSTAAGAAFDPALAHVHATLGRIQCYTWGAGKSCQLGYRVYENPEGVSPLPRPVEVLPAMLQTDSLALFGPNDVDSRYDALACGSAHTIVLTASGSIITWGANGFGQCSRASVAPHVDPARPRFFADEKLVSVSCGGVHTLVLTAAGRLLAFGCNAAGQLGAGSISSSVQPVPQMVGLPLGAVVAQIACGEEFSCVLLSDGCLLTWGFGGCGQLGHGSRRSLRQPTQVECDAKLKHVACGAGHMVAVTADGSLLRWGYEGTWDALQQRVHKMTELNADESSITGLDMRPRSTTLETADSASMGSRRAALRVAAGRHFAAVLAEALTAMAPKEAATVMQRVTRARQKRLAALRAARERAAANVFYKHAIRFMVRRELARADEEAAIAIREKMATRLQAHARRRALVHKLAKRRLEESARREHLEFLARRDRERLATLERSHRALGSSKTMRVVGGGFAATPPGGTPTSSPRRRMKASGLSASTGKGASTPKGP
eukprot:scaffold232823_cov32-Tisochrysis_lutea.AAC.1